MTSRGVTLVEILVALSVLAVGAVALSAWQLTLLRVALATRDLNYVLQVAETELQHRLLAGGLGSGCEAGVMPPDGPPVECRVLSEACQLEGGFLSCGVPGPGHLERVTVSVSGSRDGKPVVVLSSLRGRFLR